MKALIEATTRMLASLLVTALILGAISGCRIGGEAEADKAGGSGAPEVLRLAVADDAEQPDAPFARYFARRVSALSDGSIKLRIVWDAAGQDTPGYERGIARLVRDGDFELGWMGARAWDRMGIESFQALQAPFLVTDHEFLNRIATGPLAARMLDGLDGQGFVGLALVPEHLRYAFGVRKPLASVDDFAGARIRVRPSEASDMLIRALGATPVHISGDDVADAVANGELDGAEASLGTNSADEGERHLTLNLPLFPKALTLFAGEDAYDRLDEDQRKVIREAARQTAAYAAAHAPSEKALMHEFCSHGPPVSAVAASPTDVAALEAAAGPVYTQLERNPQTEALIAAFRALKARTPPSSTGASPRGCVHEPPTSTGRERSPSTLNGTYRWRLTKEGARSVGVPAEDEDVGSVVTMTLRDGGWQLNGDDYYSGTFSIRGNRLVFEWPRGGTTNTYTFTRLSDGDIDVRAVLPMDRGDQFVMTSAPWRRVGPPVRAVPPPEK